MSLLPDMPRSRAGPPPASEPASVRGSTPVSDDTRAAFERAVGRARHRRDDDTAVPSVATPATAAGPLPGNDKTGWAAVAAAGSSADGARPARPDGGGTAADDPSAGDVAPWQGGPFLPAPAVVAAQGAPGDSRPALSGSEMAAWLTQLQVPATADGPQRWQFSLGQGHGPVSAVELTAGAPGLPWQVLVRSPDRDRALLAGRLGELRARLQAHDVDIDAVDLAGTADDAPHGHD